MIKRGLLYSERELPLGESLSKPVENRRVNHGMIAHFVLNFLQIKICVSHKTKKS